MKKTLIFLCIISLLFINVTAETASPSPTASPVTTNTATPAVSPEVSPETRVAPVTSPQATTLTDEPAASPISESAADEENAAGDTVGTENAAPATPWGVWILYIGVIGGMFYLLMIKPQRDRKKREKELTESLKVGVDITTIGGIGGKIVSIKDDNIIIETGVGNEKSRVLIAKWAIRDVAQKEKA